MDINALLAEDRIGTALCLLGPATLLFLIIIIGYALTHADWSKVHEPGIRPYDEA